MVRAIMHGCSGAMGQVITNLVKDDSESGKVMGFGSPKEIITSETLQSVYDIEMDVITTHDRYGRERTICLPVNSSPKAF